MSPSAEEWSRIHLRRHAPLSKDASDFIEHLKADAPFRSSIRCRRGEIRRLERWLASTGRKLSEITPRQLEYGFPRWCKITFGYPKHHCDTQYYGARSFIIWLIREGRLPGRHATDFYPQSLKSIPLPPCALEFIEQRNEVSRTAPRRYGQLFHLFHQWLSERHIELAGLKHQHVRSYLNFLDKRGYQPKPLHVRRLQMRIYLDWLRDRNLISCDCRDLFGTKEQYRNFELPDFAEEYLSERLTHLSRETVQSYRTGIRGFHRFLQRQEVQLSKLSRSDCVHWMEWMFENEYGASTRLQRIVTVKGYLAWVVDRGIHRLDVNHLLRSDDLPQLDDRLPRPLPPSVDEEIQKRLQASQDVFHKGALLLRYTGIRLGDLERLSANPVKKDEKGRSFLLVPPGKIKVERMIPIEPRTVSLIEYIQRKMIPSTEKWGNDPKDPRLFVGRVKNSCFNKVYRRFKDLVTDLETPEVGSIYPHRLRHTYATTLLNAGLHPAVLMALLGHTDFRMTFRYAKINSELVHRAYFTAYERIQKGIRFPTPQIGNEAGSETADPVALLQVAAKWLATKSTAVTRKKTTALLKRLQKLTRELQALQTQAV